MLGNLIYLGEVTHKGASYPGEHEAIIEHGAWDKAHAILEILTSALRLASNHSQTIRRGSGLCRQ